MPRNLVPAPPPITPSIVAPGSMPPGADHDDMLAEEIFSQLPPPANAGQRDEADEILDSLPPPQQSLPLPPPIPNQPKPAPKSKTSPQVHQASQKPKPVVTRRQPAMAAAPPAKPAAQPTVLQQPTGDVLQGIDSFVGQGLKAAQSVPLLSGFMQQSQANAADVKRNPFEAAVSTLAAAPAGALGFIDDIINIPAAQQGLGAPSHLREGYLGLPGVKRLTEAYPGAAGTGEFAGAAAVPVGVPMGPLKAIKNPMVRGGVHGAVAGGAFGTISAGGQQAKRGERPNLGKALKEGGLPGAALGATAGVAVGKLTSKGKQKAPEAQQPKTPSQSPDAITLKDGSTFTPDEAMARVDNPATPEAVKLEILEQLDARDQRLAGAAPVAKTEVKAELAKPEEGLKPAQPAMRLDPAKGPAPEPVKTNADTPVAEPVKPLEDPQLDAKISHQEYEIERYGKAFEPLETQRTSLGKSKQREGEYVSDQEAITAQKLTDSQLEQHWQDLEIERKRDSTTKAQEKRILAQQDILNAETMRRADRRQKGLEENWAKEPEAETTDYTTMPDDELVRLMEAGDDNALSEFLERVPQNKPISTDAGAGELAPLQVAQEQPIAQPETAPPAVLADATTGGALDFSPEANTPQIAEIKPETAQPSGLYQYRKTAKGYEVYNESTGDVARKNWSEAKVQTYVDGLNKKVSENPEFERSQGRRSAVALQKGTSDIRQAIVGDGQALPESASPSVKSGLDAIAEAKHSADELRAKAESAYDALQSELGKPQKFSVKRKPAYNKQLEEEMIALGQDTPDQLSFEVQNSVKLTPQPYQFKPGMTAAEKAEEVLNLMQQAKAAKDAIKNAKAPVESELRAGIDNGLYPRSINIKHGKGSVNIRLKPKQGTALDAEMQLRQGAETREEINRTQAEVKNWLKDARDADANYQANANSTRPVRAKGIRSQRGAINLGLKKQHQKPQQQPAPAAAAVAQGANKSPQIADWANDVHKYRPIIELRRSLDIARERSAQLHNSVWESISKETLQGRGIKFEPEHEALINDSLHMDPSDIRMGADGLNVLSAAQRNYLATRRTIRQTTGKAIKAEREAWLNQYGDKTENMPTSVRHDYEIFEQLEHAFTGGGGKEGTSEFSEMGGILTGAMYDYVFKWNPAYHSLNLFDPLVVGSSRAGIQRVMAAKMVQQTDPKVREFLGGIESKSPIDQLRAETRIKTAKSAAIKPTLYSKGKQAIANLQGKLPDLPSEKWNFNDSLAAGLIMRGDSIKHPGGGVKYLQDMAAGKLSQDEMVKAMVDGLQVADDITGAGALGVNKDPVQRNPAMKFVTQFTSQPYRVARLLKQYATAGEADKIATFLAMTALVSGRAALPKETDILKFLANKEARQVIYAVENALDAINLVDDIPVIGRDLTDKMRFSLIPVLGGLQTNMVIDNITTALTNLAGKKYDKIAEAVIWQSISGLLGGGGLEMERIKRETENAQKGDKKVYAPHPLPYGEMRPDKSTFKKIAGRDYTAGDALGNMILPGRSPVEGRYVKEAQRKRLDK